MPARLACAAELTTFPSTNVLIAAWVRVDFPSFVGSGYFAPYSTGIVTYSTPLFLAALQLHLTINPGSSDKGVSSTLGVTAFDVPYTLSDCGILFDGEWRLVTLAWNYANSGTVTVRIDGALGHSMLLPVAWSFAATGSLFVGRFPSALLPALQLAASSGFSGGIALVSYRDHATS
jgi:hypothetical protein